jgi:hypothetical protein
VVLSVVGGGGGDRVFLIFPQADHRPVPGRDQAGKRGDPGLWHDAAGAGRLFQMADAMQVMALGLLRGMQDTRCR